MRKIKELKKALVEYKQKGWTQCERAVLSKIRKIELEKNKHKKS